MKQYTIYDGKILVNEGTNKTTYYYRTTIEGKRKKINLGHDRNIALQKLREIETKGNIQSKNLTFIWENYSQTILLEKSKKTQLEYGKSWKQLKKIFGNHNIDEIRRSHVILYLTERKKNLRDKAREDQKDRSGIAANREIALLSILFNHAIDVLEYDLHNPCTKLKKQKAKEKHRRKYIQHWEYDLFYNAGSPNYQNVWDLLYYTGLRIADVLKLEVKKNIQRNVDVTYYQMPDGSFASSALENNLADVLVVETNKTEAPINILIEGGLKDVIDRIFEQRKKKKINSIYLIADEEGQQVSYFKIYNEFRRLRKDLGYQSYDIQIRDVRRKNAREDTAENSQARLGHASITMTEMYRDTDANVLSRPITRLK